MNTAILTPAYGRDYSNKNAVIAAFDSQTDFIINNITDRWYGKPCNKNDLQKFSEYTHAELRYNKKQDCVIVDIYGG